MPPFLRRLFSAVLAIAFVTTSLYLPSAQAGEMVVPVMPTPGTMVGLSPAFTPAHLKGITIHADNPLMFDFLVHKGDGNLSEAEKNIEYTKLVKYFLASLAVPDQDQWVNLSPYEKNRIINENFGKTEMGRDLLSQDYLLKQITSSLMYPESGLGKTFWNKVYERAQKEFGTANIPVNTFNKVWITPDEVVVYENGNSAYVLKTHLKVMLEEDYLAQQKNNGTTVMPEGISRASSTKLNNPTSKVVREILLPTIEKEVNEGKNFAMLRQVVSGMALAGWYKKALKESLLAQVYADKSKVGGVDQNPANNQAIYQQYIKAFKKGAYNYIKEDTNNLSKQPMPRKYFAGGFALPSNAMTVINTSNVSPAMITGILETLKQGLERAVFSLGFSRNPQQGDGNAGKLTRRALLAGASSVAIVGSGDALAQQRPGTRTAALPSLVPPNQPLPSQMITKNMGKFIAYVQPGGVITGVGGEGIRANQGDFVEYSIMRGQPAKNQVTNGLVTGIRVSKDETTLTLVIQRIVRKEGDYSRWRYSKQGGQRGTKVLPPDELSIDLTNQAALRSAIQVLPKPDKIEDENGNLIDQQPVKAININDYPKGTVVLGPDAKINIVRGSAELLTYQRLLQIIKAYPGSIKPEAVASEAIAFLLSKNYIRDVGSSNYEVTDKFGDTATQEIISKFSYNAWHILGALDSRNYGFNTESVYALDIGIKDSKDGSPSVAYVKLRFETSPDGSILMYFKRLSNNSELGPFKFNPGVTRASDIKVLNGQYGLFRINPWALYSAEEMGSQVKWRYGVNIVRMERDGSIKTNPAMKATDINGGIDLANSNIIIKRDGKGMVIPFTQKDLAQLSNFGAILPRLIEITPATSLPFLSELMDKAKPREMLASSL